MMFPWQRHFAGMFFEICTLPPFVNNLSISSLLLHSMPFQHSSIAFDYLAVISDLGDFRVSKMMDRTRLLWRTQWSNSHFTGCYHPISYLSSLQVPFVIVLMLLNLRGISNLCPSPLKNKEPKGTIILNMFTSKWIRSSRYFYQRLNN